MVLFINGAFGVGKTTVAQRLKRRLPNSIIFDPEKIGFLLRRLPRWAPLNGHGSGDYQDMPLWRELSTRGIRLARLGWRHILVPMAFTNLAYFKSIAEGVAKSDSDVRHFCLVAPLEVVRERLLKRGSDPIRDAWSYRRAAECCAIHGAPQFGEHVPTERRSVEEVVEAILIRIEPAAAGR